MLQKILSLNLFEKFRENNACSFHKQFEKEIRKINDKNLARLIEEVILAVKAAPILSEVRNLKKLSGHKNAYRIRIGDFRIGIYVNENTVEFSRFLHRREVYRYFP